MGLIGSSVMVFLPADVGQLAQFVDELGLFLVVAEGVAGRRGEPPQSLG